MPDQLNTHAVLAHEAAHPAERRLIINPYVSDPADVSAWNIRDDIKEIDLLPPEAAPSSAKFVQAGEEFLALNRADFCENALPHRTLVRSLPVLLTKIHSSGRKKAESEENYGCGSACNLANDIFS